MVEDNSYTFKMERKEENKEGLTGKEIKELVNEWRKTEIDYLNYLT